MPQSGSKIKAIVPDGFGDDGAGEVIDGQAGFDAGADLGRGDRAGMAFQGLGAHSRIFTRQRLAGTRDDEKSDQAAEFGGVFPLGQKRDMVSADEPEEFGGGVELAEVADGVDGVGDAAAVDFEGVDLGPCFAGEGEAEEGGADGACGGFAIRLEGGLRGGDEDDAVEFGFFEGGLGNEEVRQVNWVERTAVDADAHCHRRGLNGTCRPGAIEERGRGRKEADGRFWKWLSGSYLK